MPALFVTTPPGERRTLRDTPLMRESLESWPTGVGVGVGVGVAVDVGVGVGVGMAGVGVGVGVGGVGVGVGVSVGVGVGVGPGWIDETAAQGENSEVLLKGSVAVALTLPRPCGPAPRLNTTENEASPLPLVVMLVVPMKRPPSMMAGSQGLGSSWKNSSWKVVFGVLFSRPRMDMSWGITSDKTAESIRGKFCSWFAPVSGSPGSFGVTPSGARSIPRPELRKI